jgi:hypothetical protein
LPLEESVGAPVDFSHELRRLLKKPERVRLVDQSQLKAGVD